MRTVKFLLLALTRLVLILQVSLNPLTILRTMAQAHNPATFDYEGTLRQLRSAAAKGSVEMPDTNQLDALYQMSVIYELRYKNLTDKKNSAYLDSSLYYAQDLIGKSHKTGQLQYEAAGNVIWGQDEMTAEADYRAIVVKFLAAISLCDAYQRTHSSPDDLVLEMESNAYSNAGYIYFLNKEYDNALNYCDQAIVHAYPSYTRGLALVYKARIYMAQKKAQAAETAIRQALAVLENQHINMRWEAMDYLAELLIEKGQPDSAIAVLRQAIAGDKKAYHLDMHYYWLGKAFLAMDRARAATRPGATARRGAEDSALAYGRLELALGERLAKSRDRLWAYELLYKAYAPPNEAATEKYAGAATDAATELRYYQQWVALSDSLGAIEHGKDISEVQHRYDYQRVQGEADRQKLLQNERLQQRTRYFLLTFLALLAMIAALLGFYLVKMRRKNAELQRKNKEILDAHFKGQHFERKRVATELHDNLSSLLAATKLSIEVLDPSALSAGEQKIFQSVLDMMDSACKEVRYIAHNMMPVDLERQGLAAALESLVAKLNQTGVIAFELTNIEPRLALDKVTAFNIYSICLELCNNILRHSKASRAAIIFKAYEKELHLLITDNGNGIPDARKDGMGIKNINERIISLRGMLDIQTSSEGTSFWFTIPLEQQSVIAK